MLASTEGATTVVILTANMGEARSPDMAMRESSGPSFKVAVRKSSVVWGLPNYMPGVSYDVH